MERQLKERLIGAAVLVAAAVIMVPEMFSGPRTTIDAATDADKPSDNQIKTYSVELQSSVPAAAETPVESPAERPLDEIQRMQAAGTTPEIAAAAAPQPAESKPQPVLSRPETTNPVAPVAGDIKSTSKQETAKPAASTAGWAVQVGSFSTQSTAQQIVAKLKGQGFPAFVGPVVVNGKTLYRVRVGALADRASAEAALQKLRGSYAGASIIAPGH